MKKIIAEIIAFFVAPLIYLGVSLATAIIWLGLSGLIVMLSPYLLIKRIKERVRRDGCAKRDN